MAFYVLRKERTQRFPHPWKVASGPFEATSIIRHEAELMSAIAEISGDLGEESPFARVNGSEFYCFYEV
jgi:hypothetical protein